MLVSLLFVCKNRSLSLSAVYTPFQHYIKLATLSLSSVYTAAKMSKSTIKSVLITGCSKGGIGSSLVAEFQRRGLHVFATARNLDKMVHLKELSNVTLLRIDVTDDASIKSAAEQVHAATGGTLDFLVNNSGAQHVAPVLETDLQAAKALFDVNVFGVLRMTQVFSPLLIAARGCVVNACSISGYVHAPWMGLYQASKAATEMMSETLRLELQPLGVRVVSLIIGAIGSNIMTGSTTGQLPDSSPYNVKSVQAAMAKLTSGKDGIKRTPADDFAKVAVNDVLNGASGRVWRGQMAGMVSFMNKFVPSSVIVSNALLVIRNPTCELLTVLSACRINRLLVMLVLKIWPPRSKPEKEAVQLERDCISSDALGPELGQVFREPGATVVVEVIKIPSGWILNMTRLCCCRFEQQALLQNAYDRKSGHLRKLYSRRATLEHGADIMHPGRPFYLYLPHARLQISRRFPM